MKCQEARQRIIAFFDGELRKNEEHELYRHLSSCTECSKYLDEARHIDSLLKKALTPIEPPEDFVPEVMRSLEAGGEDCIIEEELSGKGQEEPKRKKRLLLLTSRWVKSGVAACVALLMLVGGLGLSGSASIDDSLAKRVLMVSRDGLSGLRRVVDTVISGKPEKVEEEKPAAGTDKPAAKETTVPETEAENETKEEEPAIEEPADDEEKLKLALKEAFREKEKGNSEPLEDIEAELGSFALSLSVSPEMSMAAILTPVVVHEGIDNVRPQWVDKNSIYYLSENKAPRDGTFVIWETDPKGSSRRLLSSTGYCMTIEHGGGVWSPNNGQIAFVTDKNGYWQIGYSNLKGQIDLAVNSASGESINPAQGVLWEYNPVLSSNGEVAFLTKRFNNVDLMAADREGKLRVLTKTPEIEGNPAWSQDGSKIAYFRYSSTGGGVKDGQIFVADKNGGSPRAVTPEMSRVDMVPSWSPDGKKIAVNLNARNEKNGLWVVNSDGSNWRKVTNKGGGRIVSWSPDGELIAFTDAAEQLYLWEVSDGEENTGCVISVEPNDQNGEVKHISWSPDSRYLLLEWKGEQTKTSAIWRAEIIKFK